MWPYTQKFSLVKSFTFYGLLDKLAILLSAICPSLHYIIYKIIVKLATLSSENGKN